MNVVLVLIYTVLRYGDSAVMIYQQSSRADHEPCMLDAYEDKQEIVRGQLFCQFHGKCMQAECQYNGDLLLRTCTPFVVPEDCIETDQYKGLPYPHCCVTHKCPDPDNSNHLI